MAILLASVAVKLYMSFYNRRIGRNRFGCHEGHGDGQFKRRSGHFHGSDLHADHEVYRGERGRLVRSPGGRLYPESRLRGGQGDVKSASGTGAGAGVYEEIQNIVLSRPEIIGIHDLVVHDYGPGHRMVSLHGEVDGSQDIFELHDAIDGVEMELQERLGCQAVIHMDPVNLKDPEMKEKKGQD